jgi:hypothetical protein
MDRVYCDPLFDCGESPVWQPLPQGEPCGRGECARIPSCLLCTLNLPMPRVCVPLVVCGTTTFTRRVDQEQLAQSVVDAREPCGRALT